MGIPELKGKSLDEYLQIKDSGMFWEWFPTATGNYHEDVLQQDKQKGENKERTYDYIWKDSDGTGCYADIKGNKIKIKAAGGYYAGVDTLLKLKDTGNNLRVKFVYSNTIGITEDKVIHIAEDKVIHLDYDEADYLYKALQVWFTEQGYKD